MKFAFVALAVSWLCLIAASWASASDDVSDAGRSPASSGDEYNFSWLDPEKKIYVLQNRRYVKANRLMASVTGGTAFSNAYRTTYSLDPRVAYYFSEAFGIEGFYTMFSNSENNTFEALKLAAPNALPTVREIRSQYGLMAHWVPWYAKINVFNQILYFDWYFSGGAGRVHSALDTRRNSSAVPAFQGQDFFSLFFGTGHQYHISNHWLVRLDFTGAFYQAPIQGNQGDNAWFSNYNFGIGLGFKL